MWKINSEQKLNPKLFDLNIEQETIREGFGQGLVAAGEENKKVLAVCADLKDSTKMAAFAEQFPDRFIEMGVAEQNMAGVSSGLAAMGKIPVMASYATFSPGRNWEQIRTTICINNANVKIAGSHAGVSVGPDGATHQALEDIALMRVLPNMTVVVPCDAIEAAHATYALIKKKGPAYIRLTREATPVMTTTKTPFNLGRAEIFIHADQPEAVIIACGSVLYNALRAAKKLKQEGTEVMVVNNHTIKPLDKKTLIAAAKLAGAVVTVEEHQKAGGLGGAVAELLAENCPVPMEIIGVDDQFGQSGEPAELIEHYGLGTNAIILAVRQVLQKKYKK